MGANPGRTSVRPRPKAQRQQGWECGANLSSSCCPLNAKPFIPQMECVCTGAELHAVHVHSSTRSRAPQQRDFFEIPQWDSELIGQQCQDAQCDAEDYSLRGPNGWIDQHFAVVAECMMIKIFRVPQLGDWNPERRCYFRAASQGRWRTFDSMDKRVEQHQGLAPCQANSELRQRGGPFVLLDVPTDLFLHFTSQGLQRILIGGPGTTGKGDMLGPWIALPFRSANETDARVFARSRDENPDRRVTRLSPNRRLARRDPVHDIFEQ